MDRMGATREDPRAREGRELLAVIVARTGVARSVVVAVTALVLAGCSGSLVTVPRTHHSTHRGAVASTHKHPTTTVPLPSVGLAVKVPVGFARLKQYAPITEVSDSYSPITADPSDDRIIAWCGVGRIGLSVNGVRSTVSTRAVGAVLKAAGFDYYNGGMGQCSDVMPLGPATVVAAFTVGVAPYQIPPVYTVALETSDGGATWTLLPAPAGTKQSGFGGFRSGTALFERPEAQSVRHQPPAYDPDRVVSEAISDTAAASAAGKLRCPSLGPCVTLGALEPENCAQGLSIQNVLYSTDHGATWSRAPLVGGQLNPCGEAELYATARDTEMLVDSMSPHVLQRSTDGGASWHDVSLPLPLGLKSLRYGLGFGPGGITLLHHGGLLLTDAISGPTGRNRGWELLRPGAQRWCWVKGSSRPRSSDQYSSITVIGRDLWWLSTGDTPSEGPAPIRARSFPLSKLRCA